MVELGQKRKRDKKGAATEASTPSIATPASIPPTDLEDDIPANKSTITRDLLTELAQNEGLDKLLGFDDEEGLAPSDEEGEDLFGDDWEDDYKELAEEDAYDEALLDDGEHEELDPLDRRQAEKQMRKRDKQRKRISQLQGGSRVPASALFDDDEDDEDDDDNQFSFNKKGKGRRGRKEEEEDDLDDQEDEEARKRSEELQLQRQKQQLYGADGRLQEGADPMLNPLFDDVFADENAMVGEEGDVDEEEEDLRRREEEEVFDKERRRGTLREWIELEQTKKAIVRKFRRFLTTFVDNKGTWIYEDRIRTMCALNKESLDVNFYHLTAFCNNLAVWLVDCPTEMLKLCDEVALRVVLNRFPLYRRIHSCVHVRITHLPLSENLRDVRQLHLNAFIKVSGVVTRRTGVFPQLHQATYNCGRCTELIGPFLFSSFGGTCVGGGNGGGGVAGTSGTGSEIKLGSCPACRSPGPFHLNPEKTIYRNYQRLTLQESPGSVPPGRLPRTKDVVLLYDLIDTARPGEEVEVTGIYRHAFDFTLNSRHGFPVFSTLIEANYLSKKSDLFASFLLTEEDVSAIRELSRDPRIGERIIRSLAPSIYGHEDVKTALALSLFGGVRKEMEETKHNIRGDINVLVLGDPGTAKSQFLKYVEKTAHRAVYTTGQGASAVGLTAAVRKDPVTREWTLEGGALVLADNGVCLIDEFDKMNDKDRTSIHEAMEQQTISISKAGIVTTLQARCAVIAAANPIRGRYDPSLSFSQNVELTEPILSRFDVLCVVRDTVDPNVDERLANFVVESHFKNHPTVQIEQAKQKLQQQQEQQQRQQKKTTQQKRTSGGTLVEEDDTIPQDLLRKYILYAKQTCFPKLTSIDRPKIQQVYADLRRASMIGGGVPMTVRHVESILRMSEANAKMHLRDYVRDEDVNVAVRAMLDSFINAQKFSISRAMGKSFRKYINYKKDNNELLHHILSHLVSDAVHFQQLKRKNLKGGRRDELTGSVESSVTEASVRIECEALEAKARTMDITDLRPFYQSPFFKQQGFTLDSKRRVIIKNFL